MDVSLEDFFQHLHVLVSSYLGIACLSPINLLNDSQGLVNYKRIKKEKIHLVSSFIFWEVHGILNASSKICSLVVNGQSFLVTDGSLLNLF